MLTAHRCSVVMVRQAGSRGINKLTFSDDGKFCVASEDSGMLQLFNTTSAKCVCLFGVAV